MYRYDKLCLSRSYAVLLLATAILALNTLPIQSAEPQDVAQAIELLAGKNTDKAAEAATWLQQQKFKDKDLETLVEHLVDERPAFPGPDYKHNNGMTSVSDFIRWLFIDMGGPATPTLIKFLKSDAKPEAKMECLYLCNLMGIDAKDTFPAIAELAKENGDLTLRYLAIKTLSTVTNDAKALLAELEPALRDKDPNIQAAAVQDLSLLKNDAKPFVPEIIKLLDSEQQIVLWYFPYLSDEQPLAVTAAEALAELGSLSNAAVPKLTNKLQHKDDRVRLAAAYAHAAISGEKEPGLNVLLNAAQQKDVGLSNLNFDAAGYLVNLAKQKKFPAETDKVFRELLHHQYDYGQRSQAISGIVALRPKDAVELLQAVVAEKETDENMYVRKDAECAIRELAETPPDKKTDKQQK